MGRGNTRLVAWEGERTVTFTMEDALISAEGFMILSGAGLIEASKSRTIKQHVMETIDATDTKPGTGTMEVVVSNLPYMPTNIDGDFAYVMLCYNGEVVTEPYIPSKEVEAMTEKDLVIFRAGEEALDGTENDDENKPVAYKITIAGHANNNAETDGEVGHSDYTVEGEFPRYDSVIVDYYVERDSNAQQIEITADKFGGNYYLEASTLFRDQNGVDMPAEFIIPNCKIQSNFTFSMASSGDPSELMRLAA